jgi:RimJ/RimL family protein N-acetyltransferase
MIELRELARTDVPLINGWRRSRALVDGLGAPYRFIGLEVDTAWFETYLGRRGVDVRCAICRTGESEPVGLVSLTNIDPVHRHAEFHLLVGDGVPRGEGIGTAAALAMLRHAFRDLNLRRVYLLVLATNPAAVRVYEKAGFRHEGTLREAAFKNGVFHDLLVMGVLSSEFTTS